MSSHQSETSHNDGDETITTPHQQKRQRSNSQPSSRSASSSGKKKKTRSSEKVPDGRLEAPWKKGLPVWVYCYDGHGNRDWKEGFVDELEESSLLGQYKIRVIVEDENGDWYVPRTYNSHNMDAIPSEDPNVPNYRLGDYIRRRNEVLDDVPEMLRKFYRCIQYHSPKESINTDTCQELDVVGKLLLDQDPDSPTAIQNFLRSLMSHDDVKKIVSIVTGNETVSVQHALAYILGQLCGIEVCESASVDELAPRQLLDKLVGSTTTTDAVECPISQVFLMSNMTARTKKYKKFHPSNSLYDSARKDVLGDPQKLKIRMKRLQTALAAIHSSQYELPKVSGPSSALLLHGIQLMIDMRGTSEMLLNKLSEDGVCRPAKVIRLWIQKLADSIEPLTTRATTPGKLHVLCNTADNADFHLFGTCKSVVPGGTILLGLESEENTKHFNKEYMQGLGKLSDVQAEQLLATKEEDSFAQEVIRNQNIAAILTAALEYNNLPLRSAQCRSGATTKPSIGDDVSFTFRSERRQGRVDSISGKNATVTFTDGNRQVSRSIPLKAMEKDVVQTSTAAGSNTSTADTASKKEEPVTTEMFNGERHRFSPSTTSISFVLTGLSSKNTETARQVVQQIINQYGEDRFNEAVHVIVADQEFMPTMINDFFARLREEDNNLPILPALAIGHAMKGLSVSMMSFYKCFFDPILEATGVKVGSPKHAKYYKGTVIRDTNELVTNSVEMAATAAAHQYLEDVGDEERIRSESLGLATPFGILNAHFLSEAGTTPDPSAHSVTVMDPYTRPMCISVTDSLKLIAADFQKWAKDKWGTTYRDEVGPSGYVNRSVEPNEQQLDPVQQQLSSRIEQDIRFQPYKDMNYFDDGENPGLYSRCKSAGVIGKSSRKDKDTLSKKLFLVEVLNERESAIVFGPARKLPKQTNSTALVLYDLLFGVERFVLVQGHLLTRIRPRDEVIESSREWLVFFKALTTSTYMRWQPNYQRLTLSFLIQLSLILNHSDKKCIDLALKRIRWTFSVNEWGDSHKCIPVDLLQEFSIVAQTKRIGGRNPTAYRNLTSRVKLSSYLRLHEIESRGNEESLVFAPMSQEQSARGKEKRSKSLLIAAFWRSVMDAINESDDTDASRHEKIQGLGSENSDIIFADRSRTFFRHIDAVEHSVVTAAAFINGYGLGFEVAIPPRGFTILRCLHRQRKRTSTAKVKSFISEAAAKCKLEAEQSLNEEKHVLLHSSNSMLSGIEKAGDGKSQIFAAILSTMSKNAEFGDSGNQIGDGPSKPVVLARTASETVKVLKNRAKRGESGQAPIFRYVDFAKDLRRHVPRRSGGNTVNDLARDIICEAIQRYYFDGIEMICLCMDVSEGMTTLRLIPHKKRGKLGGLPHGSFSKVKKGTDDLTPYGAM